ncbi:putative serine/threonine protein kinase ENV7 [Sugiyamaella lignohabitans]|uniref:non-specific serine/threonine protein kinase n=1 Tax=Sugiyamaella lignohabitans TaxID=796027 RepID=A0A167FUK7_9ASCO|nr:putative serine/threonine protein kinase ENV7 [Sugiyamaella lignohabitans]ANB15722.1 putative serine/threonine protein kinase ENV7 [Sugiyamaella lignohabitans]
MSYISDFFDSFASCLTCFQSPALRINNRKFKIVKLLGEGGFSYVYLVQDIRSDQLFALKKIRCPFGQESIRAAMREIEAYKLFKSDYIIRAVDSAVVQEKDGSKTVYILLPYFEEGNLQDKINDNLIDGSSFKEQELVQLIIDICKGLRVMHNHHGTVRDISSQDAFLDRISETDTYVIGQEEEEEEDDDDDDDDDDDEGDNGIDTQTEGEDDNDGGTNGGPLARGGDGSEQAKNKKRDYSRNSSNTNVSSHESHALLLNPDDTDGVNDDLPEGSTPLTEIIPFAHRDIKPANIMISHTTGKPVLMDLGSCSKARVHLRTRQQALELQDLAAEHCTLPYRAPELFDVKTNSSVDERVDIWSLGCSIFALMYSASPFELQNSETGANLSMAIINGQYKFPTTPVYSDKLKDLVKMCLTVSPTDRPTIDQVLEAAEALAQ